VREQGIQKAVHSFTFRRIKQARAISKGTALIVASIPNLDRTRQRGTATDTA